MNMIRHNAHCVQVRFCCNRTVNEATKDPFSYRWVNEQLFSFLSAYRDMNDDTGNRVYNPVNPMQSSLWTLIYHIMHLSGGHGDPPLRVLHQI